MTDKQLARLLIEELADANIDRKVAVFVNRLMLRLHSQPALLSNLDNVAVFKPGIEATTSDQVEDGQFQEDDDEAGEGGNEKKVEDQDAQQDQMDAQDSPVTLQLSFKRLPREVIMPLVRLIAAPRDPKLFRYTRDGFARLGVEIDLKPSDFPGDDYDYSF